MCYLLPSIVAQLTTLVAEFELLPCRNGPRLVAIRYHPSLTWVRNSWRSHNCFNSKKHHHAHTLPFKPPSSNTD